MQYILMIKTFIAAIKTVQELMPESAGKDKFAVVMHLVEEVVGKVDSYAPTLFKLATLLVDGYRSAGVASFNTSK